MMLTFIESPTNKLRRISLALAAGLAINLTSPGAAQAQLAPVYNQLINTVQQQLIKTVMAKMGLGVEGAVTQSGAATQAEILKTTIAKKASAEALESYRQEQNLKVAAQEMVESLKQPVTTCQTMAMQDAFSNVNQITRKSSVDRHSKVVARINNSTNTLSSIDESYRDTNKAMCSAAEGKLGICTYNSDEAKKVYAGADQNVANLFQGFDGSSTFVGGPDGQQAKAVDGYVKRVVAGMPPNQLSKPSYNKSPASRAYLELQRRYAAVLSMSSYSLTQILSTYVAQVGLGTNTQMADVDLPQFTKGKADMSMQEAVQRFVATKFSPAAMADAGNTVSPNLILRDMAQMNSFQLWIDQQTLLQDTRTESLMAHQLALLTEQVLRPQLDAQRKRASRN